jgi:hypothetical protein
VLFDAAPLPITPPTVFKRLEALAGPVVHFWREDLTKHDRDTIEAHPGRPFLHFTRETGTDIFLTPTAEDLPAPGETVPYLFGRVDRGRWLENYVEGVRGRAEADVTRLCLYFDGRRFQRIEPARAIQIATDAAKRLRDADRIAAREARAAR